MSTHTPGPWTYDACGGNFYVFGPDMAMIADNQTENGFVPDETIARMRGTGRGATDEEKEANARLIAAAPELLAACKAALILPRPWMDGGVTWQEWDAAFIALEAAIAKAEGAE